MLTAKDKHVVVGTDDDVLVFSCQHARVLS